MTTNANLTRVAKMVLAGRARRRHDGAKQDSIEGALLRAMAERGQLKLAVAGVTFYASPAKIHGSPSERRKWRALLPEGALPAWRMPRELTIIYPTRGAR